MDILFLLIPLSVVLAFVIGAAFWLAVDGGQFDDLDGPALTVVADDDRPVPPESPDATLGGTMHPTQIVQGPPAALPRPR